MEKHIRSLISCILFLSFSTGCSMIDKNKTSGIQKLAVSKKLAEASIGSTQESCKDKYNSAELAIEYWINGLIEAEIAKKEQEFFSKIDLSEEKIPQVLLTAIEEYIDCSTPVETKLASSSNDTLKKDTEDEILVAINNIVGEDRKNEATALRYELEKLLLKPLKKSSGKDLFKCMRDPNCCVRKILIDAMFYRGGHKHHFCKFKGYDTYNSRNKKCYKDCNSKRRTKPIGFLGYKRGHKTNYCKKRGFQGYKPFPHGDDRRKGWGYCWKDVE